MLRAAIALVVGLTTFPSYAQVFKCVDTSGNVEYRNSPCPAEAQADLIDAQNGTDEASPGVRRRAENSKERKRIELNAVERQAAIARAARPRTAVAALPPPPGK
jgi:uncharacterized protein DUF4124